MQFGSVKTLYISNKSRVIFEELDKVRPENISFSSFLAYVSGEYLKDNIGIEEIKKLNSNIPHLNDNIFEWNNFITSCEMDELKNIQHVIVKLQNLIDDRVNKILC